MPVRKISFMSSSYFTNSSAFTPSSFLTSGACTNIFSRKLHFVWAYFKFSITCVMRLSKLSHELIFSSRNVLNRLLLKLYTDSTCSSSALNASSLKEISLMSL